MKVITWNVNGRVDAGLSRQLKVLVDLGPDILCLQEVRKGKGHAQWCQGLTDAGFSLLTSNDLLALPYPAPPYPSPPFPGKRNKFDPNKQIKRSFCNLIASTYPIGPSQGLEFRGSDDAKYAFPEKYLAARIVVDGVPVEVHNAHLPPGVSRGHIKTQTLKAIARRVAKNGGARILCGDFNELPEDGDDPYVFHGDPDPDRTLWGEAKTAIFANPEMREVYRDVHRRGKSWPVSYRSGWGKGVNPRRYDHIFASKDLVTEECRYHDKFLNETKRRPRLSDHAPIEAVLSLNRTFR